MTIIDISQYIKEPYIIADLNAKTQEDAIKELTAKIYEYDDMASHPVSLDMACHEVIKREKIQTTAVGNGVALPHARIEGWGPFKVVMGISREGIDFKSVDRLPVKILFLLISDSNEPYLVLQAMSAIVRFLMSHDNSQELLARRLSSRELADKFKGSSLNTPNQILARDLARPIKCRATLETSIEEATRTMHLNHVDILPVVDGRGRFCGELSCLEVFQYGMPDFFKQLNTISFIRHIDPFEKYFHFQKNLKVRDLYVKDVDVLHEDKTLVEIIFEMTVKQRSRLFVVGDDGALVGAIDRFTIIDKILFS